MSIISSLLLIAFCLAASAFFSGSETALFRLRGHDLEEEVDKGNGPAGVAVRDLTSSSSRLLVTILLGNNIVNILGASVASALAIRFFGLEIGITISTFVMTFLVLVFCEVLPKAAAARHPRGVSRLVGLPLYLIHQCLRPVHALFDRVIEPLVRRVTGGTGSEDALSARRRCCAWPATAAGGRGAGIAPRDHRRHLGRSRDGRLRDHGAADGDRRLSDPHVARRPAREDARRTVHARAGLQREHRRRAGHRCT